MSSAPSHPFILPRKQVIAHIDWADGEHRRSLVKVSSAALQAGDVRTAWLLADRLVRISNRHSAIPYILRASSLARMGKRDEAVADLGIALSIDPENLMLQQALLEIGVSHDRRRAAEMLLAEPRKASQEQAQALTVAAEEGVAAILEGDAGTETLTLELRWRGPQHLHILGTDGQRRLEFELAGAPSQGHAAFPYVARLTLNWPLDCEALAFRPADSRMTFLALPRILYRPGRERPALGRPGAAASLLMVVVPVHDDREATVACLDSLRSAMSGRSDWRAVVIDDASPDRELSGWLREASEQGRFTLLRNALNLGFARSVNRALALRQPDEDVLLLNADTIVPPGAIERLAAAVASAADIGTATPLSNNGEDTSVPRRFAANPMPDAAEIARLDDLARRANAGERIEMPNGVGFCLYVKAAVIERIGPLSLGYGRGYYEDVDFCLRASAAGFRNVCAADVFVGHSGSRSFRGEKAGLVRANLARLERNFPAHRERALAFHRNDPLKPAVQRLEALWLREAPQQPRLVLVQEQVPLWLVRLIANIGGDGRSAVIGRTKAMDGGLVIQLRATGSGMPQQLDVAFAGSAATDPHAIAAELSSFGPSSLLVIDPGEISPAVLAACEMLSMPLSFAVASAFGLAGLPSGRASGPLLVAGPLLRQAAVAAGLPEPAAPRRPAMPPAPERASLRHPGGCLALLAEGDGPPEWELALAIARAMAVSSPDAQIVFAGEPGAGLRPAGALFPSGPMARAETTGWLSAVGVDACVVASRPYGLSDPRSHAWAAAGMPIAYFAPGMVSQADQPHTLLLPLQADDEMIAARVSDWFRDLIAVRASG